MPYEYRITTITASVSYEKSTVMNLYNIANFIEIDSVIIGLKYMIKPGEVLTRGEYKKDTNPFYNQISLVMHVNRKLLNVKIFKNGSLHITGCKTISDPYDVSKILERYYKHSETLEINVNLKNLDGLLLTDDSMLYSARFKQVFGSIVKNELWLDNLVKNLTGSNTMTFMIGNDKVSICNDGFISNTVISNKRTLYDKDGQNIGATGISLYNNCSKLFKHNNLFIDYISNTINVKDKCIGKITYNYKQVNNKERELVNKDTNYSCSAYQNDTVTLYSPHVNINCINILFNVGFKINRQALFNILYENKYTVMYDPDKYSGVRLVSRISNQKVSFMIFHSGNVIGSGFKSEYNIKEHLDKLESLISVYKDEIVIGI
jgi:TATA-box binding protein (TBP) (component of TFIID and TFIIIB)